MSTVQPLAWRPEAAPPALHPLLRLLGEEYPLREGDPAAGELRLRFEVVPDELGSVSDRQGDEVLVRYARPCDAGRAIGTLLAGLLADGERVVDRPAFPRLGITLDCGHNATIKPAHLRHWLRRLALLGFNVAMIYTEAGYHLPDEPAFGYLRGAYSADDLRALDAYAADLGIELVGCIQALGHLEQVLKWGPNLALRDTEHTLLVGDPRTDALVEKMIAHWADVFRSRRLHLGMDETYDLGRGRALDRDGYRPGLELYGEHLARAAAACARHGLRPMIWSDVLFRLAGGAGHYSGDDRSVQTIAGRLPAGVELVYWDYYSSDAAHYRERIRLHRELGCEPIMASGVWSWPCFWHNWAATEANAGACIDACREAGLAEVLFTMWSDDGAFWELDSSFAGLAWVAERCHEDGAVDEDRLARRFAAITGGDLAVHRAASRINEPLTSCSTVWDDPLLAIYLRHIAAARPGALAEAEAHYVAVAEALAPHRGERAGGDVNHAWLVARLLAAKVGLEARLSAAYAAGDRAGVAAARDEIPEAIARVEAVARSLRALWLARCEPFGLEVLQIRFAGLAARYRELADRLGEWLAGTVDQVPELEANAEVAHLPASHLAYRALATGSRVF